MIEEYTNMDELYPTGLEITSEQEEQEDLTQEEYIPDPQTPQSGTDPTDEPPAGIDVSQIADDPDEIITEIEEAEDLDEEQFTGEDQPIEPIIENTLQVPTIGAVSSGDIVMMALVDGELTVIGVEGSGDKVRDDIISIEADIATISTLVATKASISDLQADEARITNLQTSTASISTLVATKASISDLQADEARIGNLETNSVMSSYLSANYLNTSQLQAGYAKIDGANITSATMRTGWIDNLMVQSGLLAKTGTVYSIDAIEINADKIKAGTIDVDRLIVSSGTDKYLVHVSTGGTISYEKLDGNIIEDRTITADKIVANSITANEITAQNIQGTGGWINLTSGTFQYQNANTGNGISWDGSNLNLTANSILIGATNVSSAITSAQSAASSALSAASSAASVASSAQSAASSALSVANSASTDASSALSGVGTLQTLVRSYGDGVLVAKNSQKVGALVNSNGSFDVVEVSWSGTTPSATTNTFAGFGNNSSTTKWAKFMMTGYDSGDYYVYGATSISKVRKGSKTGTSLSYTTSSITDGIKVHVSSGLEQGTYLYIQFTCYSTISPYFTIGNRSDDTLIGTRSASIGKDNNVSGYCSIGIGKGNEVHNYGSLAIGYNNDVGTIGGGAIGADNVVKHPYAMALGRGLVSRDYAGIVLGQYNDSSETGKLIVGNGASSSSRSNILVLDGSGNLKVAGTVKGTNLYRTVSGIDYSAITVYDLGRTKFDTTSSSTAGTTASCTGGTLYDWEVHIRYLGNTTYKLPHFIGNFRVQNATTRPTITLKNSAFTSMPAFTALSEHAFLNSNKMGDRCYATHDANSNTITITSYNFNGGTYSGWVEITFPGTY